MARLLPLACLPLLPMFAAEVRLEPDRSKSYFVVVTRKTGLFSFAAGHDHAILAAEWSADICFDQANPRAGSVTIRVPVKSLRIDTAEARRLGALEGKGPGPGDVKEIQEKMLGPENLAAARHPEIQFRTTAVDAKDRDTLMVTGPLTIRGVTKTVSAPIRVERPGNDAVAFSGELRVKQSDYGIKPASVAGVVKVKDAVEIRFQIHARTTGAGCMTPANAAQRPR